MSLSLYRIGYFAFWTVSYALLPFSKKFRRGFLGRRGLEQRLQTAKTNWIQKGLNPSPYWFHFASAGELEQAIPIAEELKKRSPKASILFTFFSPSGEKAVRFEKARREKANRPLPWDAADYLPLDLSWKVTQVLEIVSPKALILINRELWPNLILKSHERNTPIFLFSSFFSSNKTKMLKIWSPYLQYLKQIGTVGDSSTELLLKTVPDLKVKSIGDTRIERVLERKHLQAAPPAWGEFLAGKKLFIGASLWKEDFEALKPSLVKMAKEFPEWRICLVPHEPEESFITAIKDWGKEQGFSFRRFSHFLQTPDEVSPLIMDQVGLLAELYRYSSLAFVGGSFKSKVHNVLEPAAYSNAIVVGPYIQNSFEATEMNRLHLGLRSVSSPQEAQEAILKRISDVSFLRSEGDKAHQYLLDRRGAAVKYCDFLVPGYF
jgi:3-deoxy-D-manno-octulosonic-acid transferase